VLLPSSIDNATYANIDQIKTTHINLTLGVDFDNRVFQGSVLHYMTAVADGVTNISLDTQGVVVTSVRVGYNEYVSF
jgi:hypothetical protein